MAKTIKKFTYVVKDKYDNMVTVYARIEKEGSLYYWYTSHLTKPQDTDGIGIYNPSNVESNLDTAEAFLKAYISMMKDSKVIVPNNHY
ncbi:hypothetical protein [Bacteroides nordii]|uniref:hypothetical protein n=1 Tax=Bacteroides nordii TaxID=291645 RepID=UPI001897922C|nr:hypothetical protein [Bacteroides nordii]